MKILLVCEKANSSDGWSRYTRSLYDGLKKNGHELHMCCNQKTDDLSCIPILKKPISYLTNPLIALSSSFKLKKLIKEIKPDIIHITVEPYAMMIPYLNHQIINRTILTIHGSYGIRPLQNFLTRIIAKRYYKLIPKFITVSNYTKDAVSKILKNPKHFIDNAHVIHNGIVLPECGERIKSNKIKEILLVGGVKPRKGILEAIEACYCYKQAFHSPFIFSIVGSFKENDPYVKEVKNKISDLDLEKEVRLLGHILENDLHSLYRKSDLFLMPALTTQNTFEGFGLVFLEANAYGIPCIGPNASGAAEAINEGISGFRIDPNNPEEIAQRMDLVLNHKKIDSKECSKWAQDHGLERVVEEVEKVYESVVSTG